MFKHIMLALVPAMVPNIIFGIIIFSNYEFDLHPSIIISILITFVNPITYIFAVIIGYTTYKISRVKWRIIIQTFSITLLLMLLPILKLMSFQRITWDSLVDLGCTILLLSLLGVSISLIDFGVESLYKIRKSRKKDFNNHLNMV